MPSIARLPRSSWASTVCFLLLVCCSRTSEQKGRAVLLDADTGTAPRQTVNIDRPSAKVGSVLSEKPYLSVRIEAESIRYSVSLNGAFIAANNKGSPANETYPVNHFARSGGNELAVVLNAWELADGKVGFDATDKIKVTLIVQQAGALEAPPLVIGSLVFSGARAGAEAVNESTPPGELDSTREFAAASSGDVRWGAVQIAPLNDGGTLLVSRQVSLPLPFLDWDFLRSDSVPLPFGWDDAKWREAHDELLKPYEVIWNALRDRDVERLMPLFEERSRETDRAFFRAPGTTQNKLREAFEQTLGDPDMKLRPLRPKNGLWYYEVGPSGKLMRLTYGPFSNGIILFEDVTAPALRTEFPIAFRKSGDRYVVAR